LFQVISIKIIKLHSLINNRNDIELIKVVGFTVIIASGLSQMLVVFVSILHSFYFRESEGSIHAQSALKTSLMILQTFIKTQVNCVCFIQVT